MRGAARFSESASGEWEGERKLELARDKGVLYVSGICDGAQCPVYVSEFNGAPSA